MLTHALIYQLLNPGSDYLQPMLDHLHKVAFKPSTPSQPMSVGMIPPHTDGESDELIVVEQQYIAFAVKIEKALIPSSVVSTMLRDRILDIERRQDRKVYRKEKLSLKDELIADLLPRALRQESVVRGYIDMERNLLVMATSSASVAEMCMNKIREAIGGLRVTIPTFLGSPSRVMTNWARDITRQEVDITLLPDLVLRDVAHESSIVRFKGIDLYGEILQETLNNGYEVEQARVRFKDTMICNITDAGWKLKSIGWFTAAPDQDDEIEQIDRFRGELWIEATEIGHLFTRLSEAFGGVEQLNMTLEVTPNAS